MTYSYDRNRGSRHERGYGYKWTQARDKYVVKHPHCVKCGAPTQHVDHIIPHNGDKRLFWNRSNWQSLCQPCHNAKTAADRTGKGMKGCDVNGEPLDKSHPWYQER